MKQEQSVYNYVSKCCQQRANKPPLVKSKNADGGLGHWTCTKCGKNCSVIKQTKETNE